ncbi:MAG TPA: acylphosphatase [Nitrososphaeraceae archaeon]|nr:acylphosphatase [Nitrososphaeraceae archaeon]
MNFSRSKNSSTDDKELISVRLLIRGKVQGVYYRFNMQQVAIKNSVVGWVRNLSDGKVEALLEGNKEDVNQVIEWSKMGPENARVDEVKVDYEQYVGKYKDFIIRYDEP